MNKINVLELLNMPLEKVLRMDLFLFVDGEIRQSDDRFYLSYKEKNIEFIFDEDFKVRTIFLYCSETILDSFYLLPNNLKFSDTIETASKKLIPPNLAGDEKVDKILGYLDPWRTYFYKDYTMRITYMKDNNKIIRFMIRKPEEDSEVDSKR